MPKRRKPRPNRTEEMFGALRLVRETSIQLSRDDPRRRVHCGTPCDVRIFMQPYVDREEAETFWILALDVQHRVIFNEPIVITRGILNSAPVHPREVFRAAIVAGAAAVIVVHNHPGGDPTPSADDRSVTRQLVAAVRLLDLPVCGHVIISRSAYASFAELGLL